MTKLENDINTRRPGQEIFANELKKVIAKEEKYKQIMNNLNKKNFII